MGPEEPDVVVHQDVLPPCQEAANLASGWRSKQRKTKYRCVFGVSHPHLGPFPSRVCRRARFCWMKSLIIPVCHAVPLVAPCPQNRSTSAARRSVARARLIRAAASGRTTIGSPSCCFAPRTRENQKNKSKIKGSNNLTRRESAEVLCILLGIRIEGRPRMRKVSSRLLIEWSHAVIYGVNRVLRPPCKFRPQSSLLTCRVGLAHGHQRRILVSPHSRGPTPKRTHQ